MRAFIKRNKGNIIPVSRVRGKRIQIAPLLKHNNNLYVLNLRWTISELFQEPQESRTQPDTDTPNAQTKNYNPEPQTKKKETQKRWTSCRYRQPWSTLILNFGNLLTARRTFIKLPEAKITACTDVITFRAHEILKSWMPWN